MNKPKNPITLFSPGPTPISQKTLEALAAPPIHHRSNEFKTVLKRAYGQLKALFGETSHKAVFTSTGTGALEASVVNFMMKSHKVLYIDGGKFGERWGEILSAYGVKNEALKIDWGSAPSPEQIEKKLLQSGPYDALCMQACETSTGTAYDLKSIGRSLKKNSPKTLFIVDGITAVGVYPVDMHEFNIDVLLSGSQKALGLPVGLSFLAFNDKAHKRAKESDLPKFYFDVLKEVKNLKEGSSTFSTPTQIWLGLEQELLKIASEEQLNEKFNLCEQAQSNITEFVHRRNDICLFSKAPSPSLTAIRLDDKYSAKVIQKKLLDEGCFVASGQGEFTDKLIRIGHMANVDLKSLAELLKTFENILDNYE